MSQQDFVYPKLKIESPNVKYTQDAATGAAQIESLYEYEHVKVTQDADSNSIKVSLVACCTR